MSSKKLSLSIAKEIRKLKNSGYLKKSECFLIEGEKNAISILNHFSNNEEDINFQIKYIVCTESFLKKNKKNLKGLDPMIVDEKYLHTLSSLSNADSVIVVAYKKENKPLTLDSDEYGIMLDDIQDPGNLGTIIRTADWYGISKVICSNQTVSFYNSKVIQATMGSFLNVNVYYTDLEQYIKECKNKIIGAFLEGENIHQFKFPSSGVILVGNESKGINDQLASLCDYKITIPKIGNANSLNVAIATGIVCDNTFCNIQ